MTASIIAYLLCGFCGAFSFGAAITVFKTDGTESLIAAAFTIVLGLFAWGFAFLGGLS